MISGKMIKDDTDLSTLKLKDGVQIMMMGTAEGKYLKDPVKQIQFIEDLTPEERARVLKEITGDSYPAGLINLGNTCYMNSVVQNLKKVKELKEALLAYQLDPTQPEVVSFFMNASKNLYSTMERKGGDVVTPFEFV